MRKGFRHDDGRRRPGWAWLVALGTVAMLAGGASFASAASARAAKKPAKPTMVVKEADRGTFGEILTTKKGATLYYDSEGPCTGGCLGVWPPLLMPKGKTIPGGPKGLTGLGTTPFGSGSLQVTYNSMPLYTFADADPTSTSGNGVAGFFVVPVG
jgi:predicted lipoprotein with Yx(FWY)xxD motif